MADKAFLSGINDYKTIGDLRGCINDTHSLRRLLIDEFGFADDHIRVRTNEEVIKSELKKGWKWLLKDSAPGDRLIFHFSGHGSQTVDRDLEEEPDRADELLCLYGMDWHDSKTYLLDDELRDWTTQIPDGVSVTFLLDCCHSGTGTRMIEPNLLRAVETDFRSSASLSIDDVALMRAYPRASVRSISTLNAASHVGAHPSTSDEIDEETVLARYAPPPPSVQLRINRARSRSSFSELLEATRSRGVDESMNHVLWSGCRDDQTSADAFINGDFHGAFTYYFCDTVRRLGTAASSARTVQSLRQTLADERFSQVPQLEPSNTDGPIFSHLAESGSGPGTQPPGDADTVPTADQWQSLLATLQQIASALASGARIGAIGARESGRSLVYCHGICQHDPGYSDPWWHSLSPHLNLATRQALAADRHEVLWSEHVTRVDRAITEAADPVEQQKIAMSLQEILQERVTREVDAQIVERGQVRGRGDMQGPIEARALEPEGAVPRAALGIPGLDCVDDFVKYLTIDFIRRAVISEFTDVIRPLLRRGDSVEVISHSWGTVVAFEAMRSLERMGLPGRVHNWFTVGSALAISFVTRRLRPDDGRKPTVVDNWINLDARGDAVGGSLQATGMQVDHEYLRLRPVGCADFFGLVSPACAHSSYFVPANTAVNRDIFSQWIEQS